MERPGYHSDFVRIGEHRLFVVEHRPVNPRGALLVCAPFLEERLFCRRFLRHLAAQLAAAGWLVMRFDGYGEGDSEGELSNADLAMTLADIRALAKKMREQVEGPLVLMGVRWGANQAFSAQVEDVDALIAIEPLSSGEEYVQQLLRQNLTTQMVAWGEVRENREALLARAEAGEPVNVQGFEVGPALVQQMRALVPPDQAPAARVSLLRLGMSDAPVSPRWRQLVDHWRASYQHINERPFWFEPRHYDPAVPALTQAVSNRLLEWFP